MWLEYYSVSRYYSYNYLARERTRVLVAICWILELALSDVRLKLDSKFELMDCSCCSNGRISKNFVNLSMCSLDVDSTRSKFAFSLELMQLARAIL